MFVTQKLTTKLSDETEEIEIVMLYRVYPRVFGVDALLFADLSTTPLNPVFRKRNLTHFLEKYLEKYPHHKRNYETEFDMNVMFLYANEPNKETIEYQKSNEKAMNVALVTVSK